MPSYPISSLILIELSCSTASTLARFKVSSPSGKYKIALPDEDTQYQSH